VSLLPRWVLAIQWLSDTPPEPVIVIPVGPKKVFVNFLIDTGAQISVITKETATCLNVKPGRRKVKFTGIDGVIRKCPTAKITLWLPGEPRLTRTEVLVGVVTTVMELVNHKARTMLLCPLYSPAHLDIRSGNRGFSP